jgi:hypothetical protein
VAARSALILADGAGEQVSHNRNLAGIVLPLLRLFADYTALMNPAELFRQDSDALQLAPGDFLFRKATSVTRCT